MWSFGKKILQGVFLEQLVEGFNNDFEIGDNYRVWNVVQCEITGGNIVAVEQDGGRADSIHNSAFTQVVRTSSSSATISELEITQLQYMIESLRASHGISGDKWFVSPYSGNDDNTGDRDDRAFATLSSMPTPLDQLQIASP